MTKTTRISKAFVNWLSFQSIVLWKSVQLQWHVQKEREKQAHSEVLWIDLQEPYIALVDMGKIIRHNRSDYVQKVSSIIFHHNNATHIICVNDPYDTLKMTNKTYKYRVGLMSPIST